jgi:hypothetical protein
MNLYPSQKERLATQHLALPGMLQEISTQKIEYSPAEGKWSIHDNIAHLAKYQLVFQSRITLILTGDKPAFTRYNADEDSDFPTWRQIEVAKLIRQIEIDRQELIGIIEQSSGQLNKIGIHSAYGSLNLVQWVEFFLLHEAHHLYTIYRMAHDNRNIL